MASKKRNREIKRKVPDSFDNIEYYYFLQNQVNGAVSKHLEYVLGRGVLDTINYHLKILADVDLSQVASDPYSVELGLSRLFGAGAKVVTEQCILAAFRSVGQVPDREFTGLSDAIRDIRQRAESKKSATTNKRQ